jgi:hypothetical protein
MGTLKRLVNFVLIGVLLGAVITSLIAPGMLAWYRDPGTAGAMCNCVETARDTANSLLYWQVVGAAIGALAMFVLGIVFTRRSARSDKPAGGALPPANMTPSVPPRTNVPPTPPAP